MSMMKRPAAVMVGLCLCVTFLLLPANTLADQPVLRVSAIPDEAPTELSRKFAPLGAYLEQELGVQVNFHPVSDYAGVVEALGAGRLDLAWLGGFTFVQARLRTGDAIPLVQREQDAVFTSTFITADPSVTQHRDLQGKSFAFGSISSTSGHLMPRYFMQQDGLDVDTLLGRVGYSGAHDATVAWVASGRVDAGVLNASVWDRLVDEGKVDTDKVRVYKRTPTYFDYNWTVRGDLDPELVDRIKQAFLKLDPDNPEHLTILNLQRASRFIATSPENYQGIEDAARASGLLQ
ncbi:MAG: putative selenate ABC transporter substrate-binding protein [Natronospirillum sp.]